MAEGSLVASKSQGDLEALLRRPYLRFPAGIERVFRADYAERWRSTNRVAFAIGLATFAAFGLVDLLATTHSLGEVWFLRFALGVPPAVAIVVLSYTSAFPRLMQPATAAVVFVFGAVVIAMEIVIHPDEIGYHLYFFGLAPVTAFGYAAPRMRFWYAATTGWAMWFASVAVGFDHGVWSTRDGAIEFSVILALLAAVNIGGMIGAYLMEGGSRRGFVQEMIAEREREPSDLLLQNILPGSVAERLKQGEEVAEAFEEATVMFATALGASAVTAGLDVRSTWRGPARRLVAQGTPLRSRRICALAHGSPRGCGLASQLVDPVPFLSRVRDAHAPSSLETVRRALWDLRLEPDRVAFGRVVERDVRELLGDDERALRQHLIHPIVHRLAVPVQRTEPTILGEEVRVFTRDRSVAWIRRVGDLIGTPHSGDESVSSDELDDPLFEPRLGESRHQLFAPRLSFPGPDQRLGGSI